MANHEHYSRLIDLTSDEPGEPHDRPNIGGRMNETIGQTAPQAFSVPEDDYDMSHSDSADESSIWMSSDTLDSNGTDESDDSMHSDRSRLSSDLDDEMFDDEESDDEMSDDENSDDSELDIISISSSSGGDASDNEGGGRSRSHHLNLNELLPNRQRPSVRVDEDEFLITLDQFPPRGYQGSHPGFRIDSRHRNVQLKNGDVFRVQDVVERPRIKPQPHSEYLLRGWSFKNVSHSKGMLSREYETAALREVYMQLNVNEASVGTDLQRGLIDVDVSEVVRNVELVLTNRSPAMLPMFATDLPQFVCRWTSKVYTTPQTSGRKTTRKLSHTILATLRWEEADPVHRIEDWKLTLAHRGEVPACKPFYSFADAFAGCGGTSACAKAAKLNLKWAFDWDPYATRTYHLNFPEAQVYHADAHHMLVLLKDWDGRRVDILHISSPCTAFSPVNTTPNLEKNAEAYAALLTIEDYIRLVKPRVVTLEQTFGIVTHHPEWFHKLLNLFTCNGYSVQWKVVHFRDYGLVQDRKRLIIFGAAPGTTIPKFPEPTHGEMTIDGDLKPFKTIREVLAPLDASDSRGVTHHELYSARLPTPKLPYSADRPLRNAIMTGGTTDVHPDGWRRFTVRELALMQGFSVYFKLPRNQPITQLKMQIGNAVPGAFTPFLEAVALALEYEDVERSGISTRLQHERNERELAGLGL